MKKVRMLGDRLLVQRLEAEEKTKSGIIIPDTAKEEQTTGKVISVGKGKRLPDGQVQEMEVKKGDRIIFGKYAGTEIKIDDMEYTILSQDDVLAKWED
jgi:chaperonin GroES